ncbi:GNAT family N-acetyltransferase [Deinococcus peraridilitoris]|uniref:Putative acetyltransferase n=1 Tax=Deinococcus peraridilitoris (strain DSM 19664 / LMG 22246 / CIP 109416 / KR-200) TaxID=937777 RepID=L0A604_DEIPD|nr:GNAT family N-acetyltransferase [Deinococcus peraridilitoris]AFZ69281.1 putative acetyltransferase [Deinococcus peraridilitoris DSM 19664]
MPEVRNNTDQQRYELVHDGELAGFLEYQLISNVVVLPHAEIDDRFEGQGLGSTLARHVLDDARTQGQRVVPACPFMAAFIQRHREYVELVHPRQRAEYGLSDG